MTDRNPEAVARALDDQAAKIKKLEGLRQALEDEVRSLRSLPKVLKQTEADLEAALDSVASANQRAQDAEVRANQLQAELAKTQAEKANLESIVQVVAEREKANKAIDQYVAGVKF